MNSTKVLFILTLHLLLSTQGYTQKGFRGCYGFDCKDKKWSLSLFAGTSLMGPGRGIKEQMIASGLGDAHPPINDPWGYVPLEDYPRKSIGLVWNIAAGYAISKKSGLQLTAGTNYHSSIQGYDRIGHGNYLRILCDMWSAAFNYEWRLRNGKDGITIGPVMAGYKVSAESTATYMNPVSGTSALKAGFNIGYSFSLVQKKSWFLAMKANYTWLPDTEIGPYTEEHILGSWTENPETYTSTFNKTKVSLSTINFGISTGFKF